MFAWVLGVTRILYCVAVVVAVMFVASAIAGVSLAGLATDPYNDGARIVGNLDQTQPTRSPGRESDGDVGNRVRAQRGLEV